MLPNKMRISERATNSLRRFQSNTGLTANIGARLAFFISFESGFRFEPNSIIVEHNGRELDKHTWLGDYNAVTEQLLKGTYSSLTRAQLHDAWAAHVDDGALRIESKTSLVSLFANYVD